MTPSHHRSHRFARPSAIRLATLGALALCACALGLLPARAQQPPVNGMRPVDLRTHAIVDTTVVPAPGQKLEHATIVIRDGVIVQVGPKDEVEVPAGAQVWPGAERIVYAGLIEPALLIAAQDPPPSAGAHWNTRVHPQLAMAEQPAPEAAVRESLRKMGFTAAAVYPTAGAFRGSGVVLALAAANEHVLAYQNHAAMMAGFDQGGGGFRRSEGAPASTASPYPGSLMGAIALLRQALYDAQWYAGAEKVWREHPEGNEPPLRADALVALADVIQKKQPVLFEANDEQMALRAAKLASEFNIDMMLLGSGTEFRRLDEIAGTKMPVIVPLNYPRRPEVATISAADAATLRDMMTWEQAPTNPRRLLGAGATVALTTHRLRNRDDFPANVRTAIKHGLTEDQALASLTTTPAKLLGLDGVMGTIEAGKLANLVVVKGTSLFDKDAKVYETWIDGRRYEIDSDPKITLAGSGTLTIEAGKELKLDFDSTKQSATFYLPAPPGDAKAQADEEAKPQAAADLTPEADDEAKPPPIVEEEAKVEPVDDAALQAQAAQEQDAAVAKPDEKPAAPKEQKVNAKKVTVAHDQVSMLVDGKVFDVKGWVQLSGIIEENTITGSGLMPDGATFRFTADITPKPKEAEDAKKEGEEKPDDEGAKPQAAEGQQLPAEGAVDPVSGEWTVKLQDIEDEISVTMDLKRQADNTVTGSVTVMGQAADIETGAFDPASRKLTLKFPGPHGGPASLEAEVSGNSMTGSVAHEINVQFTATRIAPDPPAPAEPAALTFRGRGAGAIRDSEAPFVMPPDNINYPLGEYGLPAPPQPKNVLITNATIWTSGPQGIIENGWMLLRDGKIDSLGTGNPPAEPGANGIETIDAAGKHVTPGLIDCHSHTGIDGGVNEGAQANTAECRIADCIDPDDINWYRQLAGGLTACNQLHGSANPIGGQNSVVKLKWGRPASEFPISNAIQGIKFALGENVKRSGGGGGGGGGGGRYPGTRMGVETFIRDAFTAARDYKAEHARYLAMTESQRAGIMPPQRDLELDALVEILEGKRLVHCHSYRQDEILMLIRVAEDFGFTIGTFQHVLEGYKVAEAIASHGAGASSFSDWWAYKMEVIDAIPYNGALLTNVGANVSFNSDSDELARRMNTEAAKAVRYGGLEPAEALKLVTINPARQLRIDQRTGSLEKGKDADFAIWSGDPLSTYSRCEQTWIEGAQYFDRVADLKMREQATAERQRLIQKILLEANGEPGKSGGGDEARGGGGGEPGAPGADRPRRRPGGGGGLRPPDDDNRAGGSLLSRMLDDRDAILQEQFEAWVEEQLRLGRDPAQMSPGDCGCNALWQHLILMQNAGGSQ